MSVIGVSSMDWCILIDRVAGDPLFMVAKWETGGLGEREREEEEGEGREKNERKKQSGIEWDRERARGQIFNTSLSSCPAMSLA